MNADLRLKRLGKLGASEAGVIMGRLTTDGLEKLVKRKAFERVFGDPGDGGYQSKAMERGQEVEEDALQWYEFHNDCIVERQLHIDHPVIPYVSATPDGLIRGSHCIEAKSPQSDAWMHTVRTGTIPSVYRWQCPWQAWCADLRFTDYVSYHPKAARKTKIIRFELLREDVEAMTARVAIVEARIRDWMRTLQES